MRRSQYIIGISSFLMLAVPATTSATDRSDLEQIARDHQDALRLKLSANIWKLEYNPKCADLRMRLESLSYGGELWYLGTVPTDKLASLKSEIETRFKENAAARERIRNEIQKEVEGNTCLESTPA